LRDVIWVDTKKDELRPIEKISTRMFAAGPMHFVIAFRMYFLPFSSWIMQNRIHNGIAVGVNPFVEWNQLANELQSRGKRVVAGDFSNFDGSLNSQILWSIFHDVYVPWLRRRMSLSQHDYNVVFGLWNHVVHSVHLNGDNLYMWTHSQPSGNPFTAILNSIYGKYILRLAWNDIFSGSFGFDEKLISDSLDTEFMKHGDLQHQRHYSNYVREIVYGDDHVVNVDDRVVMWFNQSSLTRAFANIGHIYTDECKSGRVFVSRGLDEVQFLKRSFFQNPDLRGYVGPLEEKTIYEMMNWVRESKFNLDEYVAVKENCETALREMVYHGREKYESLCDLLLSNKKLFLNNSFPLISSYSTMIRDVKSGRNLQLMSYF